MSAQMELPKEHPMRAAWEAYRASAEYANTKHWALRVAPMIQADDPATRDRLCELLPLEQRTRLVEGSLWAAFSAGWEAHLRCVTAPTVTQSTHPS